MIFHIIVKRKKQTFSKPHASFSAVSVFHQAGCCATWGFEKVALTLSSYNFRLVAYTMGF